MNVLVTGSGGFIGRNLMAWLAPRSDLTVLEFDRQHSAAQLHEHLTTADIVFHLAGVNRPESEAEFRTGNVDLTTQICDHLLARCRPVPMVLSSSIQALLDNPYGISKRQAEEVVRRYAEQSGAPVTIYRLPNVFGKWCRPHYNSVVATFCHQIARDLPITISDPENELELVYIDDVLAHFSDELTPRTDPGIRLRQVTPTYHLTLGQLAALIRSFREIRQTLIIPDLSDSLIHKLHGTYLSYLEASEFAYHLDTHCDPRGCLAEFVKAAPFGQIFVSRTAPGVTRGDHYHHTKTEKFLVLQGQAVIRFRPIRGGQIIEHRVAGDDFRVVDIPPGYTHSIENTGPGELITLFWSSELYDPARTDTYPLPVMEEDR